MGYVGQAPISIKTGGTNTQAFNPNGLVITGSTTTSPLSSLTLTNGQLVVGSTGATPVATTITAGSGISVNNTAGAITISATGGASGVTSFHPDSGTDPVVPNGSGLVNSLGSGSITTVGSLNTITTQLTGLTNHSVLVGAGTSTITKVGPTAAAGQVFQSAGAAADPVFSTATYPSTTTASQLLYSSATNTVSGLVTANKAVLTTGATGIPVLTPLSTNGTFIIGSTAGVPASGTLTSTGGTITITPGSNTINIETTGGASVVTSFHPNSGTDPVVPNGSGLVNLLGTGSTTVVGSLNTLTVGLTGLTNHAVLVGAGTATVTNVGPTATAGQVLQSAGGAADPLFSTATYPSTTTANQVLYSSAANTVSGLATANKAVLTTGATGVPVLTAISTDGTFIIGSTAGAPASGTLTSTGGTISITPGSNTINIEALGGGTSWTNVAGTSVTAVVNHAYTVGSGGNTTVTMPASGTFGDTIRIVNISAANDFTIQCVGGQTIQMGSLETTAGGTVTSVNAGGVSTAGALELLCGPVTTTWHVISSVGAFALT